MSKKDYERAARIVRIIRNRQGELTEPLAELVEESFVTFFAGDNRRFNEQRFRTACRGAVEEQEDDEG